MGDQRVLTVSSVDSYISRMLYNIIRPLQRERWKGNERKIGESSSFVILFGNIIFVMKRVGFRFGRRFGEQDQRKYKERKP